MANSTIFYICGSLLAAGADITAFVGLRSERFPGRATPVIALFGSSRLPHVLVQTEIETFAIEADGTVAWRVAHSDVVTAAELVGGRLVLTSFAGQVVALDPSSGRPA